MSRGIVHDLRALERQKGCQHYRPGSDNDEKIREMRDLGHGLLCSHVSELETCRWSLSMISGIRRGKKPVAVIGAAVTAIQSINEPIFSKALKFFYQ